MLCVLSIVAGGAVGIVSSTQPWMVVTLRTGATETLEVAGAAAMPLVVPLSLAALALGLALSIVGRVLRYAFGVIAAAMGVALAVGAVRIAATLPMDAVAGTVTESTGLGGIDTVTGLVAAVTATVWPVLAAASGALLAAGGVGALITAHTWAGAGRRYRQDTTASVPDESGSRPHDAIDDWDELSRGDDPTR